MSILPRWDCIFKRFSAFCFEEQRLLPGETVDMPVIFFIDPEMLVDDSQDVTLSYTFFQTDEDDDVDN
jgi:cytochrome c oxidase assembly protein subunit 11